MVDERHHGVIDIKTEHGFCHEIHIISRSCSGNLEGAHH